MGRPIPFNEIPDSTILPTGHYILTIESFEPGVTKTPPERLQYRQQLRVVEPSSHANLVVFDSQTIGNADDPDAEYVETWQQSGGARRLKAICNAAGIQEDDDDRLIAAIEGQQVLAYIEEYTEPDTNRDGSPNQYAGQLRNRIGRYYKVGDREPGLMQPTAPNRPQRTAATPPGAQRPAPQQQAQRPAAQPARPQAQARPAQQTRAPLQRPQPGAAKPAPAAQRPAARPAPKAQPKPQVQEVVCSLCGEDENGNPYTVPEDQFEDHVQQHEAEAGNA